MSCALSGNCMPQAMGAGSPQAALCSLPEVMKWLMDCQQQACTSSKSSSPGTVNWAVQNSVLPTAEKGAGKALPVAQMCKSTCHLSVTALFSSSTWHPHPKKRVGRDWISGVGSWVRKREEGILEEGGTDGRTDRQTDRRTDGWTEGPGRRDGGTEGLRERKRERGGEREREGKRGSCIPGLQ